MERRDIGKVVLGRARGNWTGTVKWAKVGRLISIHQQPTRSGVIEVVALVQIKGSKNTMIFHEGQLKVIDDTGYWSTIDELTGGKYV